MRRKIDYPSRSSHLGRPLQGLVLRHWMPSAILRPSYDLGELILSRFMFRYTLAINKVASLLSPEELDSFKNKINYNEDAKEFCNRIAEGIQTDKDLTEIREEFNRWPSEFELTTKGGTEVTGATELEGGDNTGETEAGCA